MQVQQIQKEQDIIALNSFCTRKVLTACMLNLLKPLIMIFPNEKFAMVTARPKRVSKTLGAQRAEYFVEARSCRLSTRNTN